MVRGGLIAYPTDSGYALGWRTGNRKAQDRVIRLRQLDRRIHFTYCCRTLSDVSRYAQVSNWAHRLIRQLTPGLTLSSCPQPATCQSYRDRNAPLKLASVSPTTRWSRPFSKTIDEPILSSSLILPGQEDEIFDTEDLYDAVHRDVDVFVDAGYCPLEPTTLLDLTGDTPLVLRQGQGVVDF